MAIVLQACCEGGHHGRDFCFALGPAGPCRRLVRVGHADGLGRDPSVLPGAFAGTARPPASSPWRQPPGGRPRGRRGSGCRSGRSAAAPTVSGPVRGDARRWCGPGVTSPLVGFRLDAGGRLACAGAAAALLSVARPASGRAAFGFSAAEASARPSSPVESAPVPSAPPPRSACATRRRASRRTAVSSWRVVTASLGSEEVAADLRADLHRPAGREVVHELAEGLRREVLEVVVVDLRHRGVATRAQALDLEPGESCRPG